MVGRAEAVARLVFPNALGSRLFEFPVTSSEPKGISLVPNVVMADRAAEYRGEALRSRSFTQ